MRRLLIIICWIRYLWLYGREWDGHFWKLKETITDADRLESEQTERNKYTVLQIAVPHYTKVYQCSVCGVQQTESGWNDMVVHISARKESNDRLENTTSQ